MAGKLAIYLQRMMRGRLARLFAGTFIAGLVSRIILLAMTIVIARQLSPEGYGEFTFATGLAILVAQFALLGWPAIMARLIPTLRMQKRYGSLRGLIRSGDFVALLGGLLAAGTLITVALFPGMESGLFFSLILTATLVLPTTFNLLRRSQLAGARRPAMGLALDQALPPFIVLMVALVLGIANSGQALVIYALATCFGAAVATIVLRRSLPGEVWTSPPHFQVRLWMVTALPLVMGLSAKQLMNRMDVLMLAPLAGLTEVGLYGVAFRMTYVLTFPQMIMMTIITPLLAESIAARENRAAWLHFRTAMIFSLVLAIPTSLSLALFAEPTIALLFGTEYKGSAGPLTILAIGQTFSALAIPCAGLLIAAGRGGIFGVINLLAAGLNATLNFLMIPAMGATGAALATAVCTAIIFSGQAAVIWHYRANIVKHGGIGNDKMRYGK